MDGAGNIFPLAYGVIDSENDKFWTWFFEQPHLVSIWHLWKNVTKNYKTKDEVLSPIFYALAKAYTQDELDKIMEKIEKVDYRVKDYLEDAGREKWARLYSPVNRRWTMTSNIAECINGKLVAARELPVFDFLEEIEPSIEFVYTVHDQSRRFIIDLKNKTCSYRVVKTYDVPVDPLPDESEWNIPKHISDEVVLPPRYKIPPGRPKKKRDKPLMKMMIGKRRNAYNTCGRLGHNRCSCSNESRKK
ncbi:uncharacterized protein LOC132032110 [Lycium ferocissimum]|uniref:uncharacterized protein LOC132032110 n=1 Tax=Lycium ferocissimum TaxID=112874 RepID=UPI0028156DEC|nr:uncharacterized protein LOC132032110 [Lycium ferocissimum]